MSIYLALLRGNRNYRNLWLGRVVSNLGDWFNLLASAALISQLTNAGTAISLLFLARFLPLFFMSPFAGVLADRFDRRRILIAADLLRAVTVLGFLLVDEPGRIWLLYVLTALQFVFSALFTPALSAFLPSIVEDQDLVTANALDSLTWSSMLAIGALLGGLATSLLGVQAAFVLDALTFLLSAWFVTRIQAAGSGQSPPSQRTTAGSGLLAFIEGMRYLLGRRTLLVIALVKAGGALIWGGINVLEIPLAEQLFPLGGNGSLTLGLIYAAVGLGTGFGPLVLRARLGDSLASMARAITISFACMTVGVFGLALSRTLPWLLVSTLVRGVGSGGLWVFATVLLQILVPDRLRGRVFAFEFAALTLAQSLSTWWAGEVYDAGMALSQILLASGVASAVVSLAWWIFQSRRGPSLMVRTPEGT